MNFKSVRRNKKRNLINDNCKLVNVNKIVNLRLLMYIEWNFNAFDAS